MRAMHLAMADCAVLVARATQIVDCRRDAAQSGLLRAYVGMAFQANVADFMPRQQLWIR